MIENIIVLVVVIIADVIVDVIVTIVIIPFRRIRANVSFSTSCTLYVSWSPTMRISKELLCRRGDLQSRMAIAYLLIDILHLLRFFLLFLYRFRCLPPQFYLVLDAMVKEECCNVRLGLFYHLKRRRSFLFLARSEYLRNGSRFTMPRSTNKAMQRTCNQL